EVLDIEPGHPDALNILAHVAALREAMDSFSDDEGLQSYDMEGVRPSQAINDMPRDAAVPTFDDVEAAPLSLQSTNTDSGSHSVRSVLPPRPSLPPQSSPYSHPPPSSRGNAAPPSRPVSEAPASSLRSSAFSGSPPSMARPSHEAIEEVLEEAEFFAAQG